MLLNRSQQISLNLRLGQRLVLKHGTAQASIGLHSHMTQPHRCHSDSFYKIDWCSDAFTEKTHPHLFVLGCPANHFDSMLFYQINQSIEIEDAGGLAQYAGSVGIAHLPFRVVDFYQDVLAARDRFLQERDHVYNKLRSS